MSAIAARLESNARPTAPAGNGASWRPFWARAGAGRTTGEATCVATGCSTRDPRRRSPTPGAGTAWARSAGRVPAELTEAARRGWGEVACAAESTTRGAGAGRCRGTTAWGASGRTGSAVANPGPSLLSVAPTGSDGGAVAGAVAGCGGTGAGAADGSATGATGSGWAGWAGCAGGADGAGAGECGCAAAGGAGGADGGGGGSAPPPEGGRTAGSGAGSAGRSVSGST